VTSSQIGEALQMLGRSSRGLVRQARATYATDLLRWEYRSNFRPLWDTVDRIPGWFREGNAVVFYGVMQSMRPATVVEIGSYLGRSTVFFALTMREVNPHGRVVAIDPHTGDRQHLEALSVDRLPSFDLFSEHLRAAGVEDLVDTRAATSLEAADGWTEPVDLLYVDGWHSYDAVIADGEAWLPHLSDRGVVVFDDYTAYDEVREAVNDLARSGRYHLWGQVFGQAIGGASADPPPIVRRALRLASPSMFRR
jgi:predicted O-methyltransferase YrrM